LVFFSQTIAAYGQQLGQGVDDGITPFRIVAALVICMVVAVAGAFAFKAWSRAGRIFQLANGRRRLQLLETLRISGQNEVCIVVCDGEELLVSSSADGVKLIRLLPGRERSPERS
jgi:hypothetical protein